MLQALARGYDELFARPFPYVMVVHQAPTDGRSDGHLHVEFYPPLRTAEKLKYRPAPSMERARSSRTCCPRTPAGPSRGIGAAAERWTGGAIMIWQVPRSPPAAST